MRTSNKVKLIKFQNCYVVEFYFNDELLISEKYIVTLDENKIAVGFDLNNIIEHKKTCCLIFTENFEINEESIDQILPVGFGLDEIINSLRPGAKYHLSNTSFTYWEHELPPPSWEEIMSHVGK